MKKISSRQIVYIWLCTVFSPAVRLFSVFYLGNAKQDAWIGPLIAGIVMIGFLFLLNYIINNYDNYFSLIEYSMGKTAKIFELLYIVWGVLLVSMHLHYYGQRISVTVFLNSDVGVFLAIMGMLCCFVLYNGMESFARMTEIIFPLIMILIVVMLGLIMKDADFSSLLPIENSNSIAIGTVCSVSGFSYITFASFFSDRISEKEKFLKRSFVGIVALSLITALIFATVIGVFGIGMIEQLNYPFFGAVKQISIGEFIQHIEAFVISLWVMSDFVIVAFIGMSVIRACRSVFNVQDKKTLIFPIYALTVSIAASLSVGEGKIHILSEKIFLPANLIFLIILPILLLIVSLLKNKRTKPKF